MDVTVTAAQSRNAVLLHRTPQRVVMLVVPAVPLITMQGCVCCIAKCGVLSPACATGADIALLRGNTDIQARRNRELRLRRRTPLSFAHISQTGDHMTKARDKHTKADPLAASHADGSTRRPETPELEGRVPLPEELTGRASGTDDDLVALFDNASGDHLTDGFRGGSDDEEAADDAPEGAGVELTVGQSLDDDDLDTAAS